MIAIRPLPELLLVATALLVAATPVSRAEDLRPYEDGPLTADDFRGEPPDAALGDAQTTTHLRYDFRYRYRFTGGATVLTIEQVEVEALIDRDTSWNRRPGDADLLAHEQGHADNAWIQCLKARLAVRTKLDRPGGWTFTARSLKDAKAEANEALNDTMQAFEKEGVEADAAYDRETRHGLGPRQGEWRRVQQATIEELETLWRRAAAGHREEPRHGIE